MGESFGGEHLNSDVLPLAVRAFAERIERPSEDEPDRPQRGVLERWPPSVLIIDTETTPEATQRLTFGSYRYCRWVSSTQLDCVEEGLFHADDLEARDPESYHILRDYATSRRADVVGDVDPTLHCFSRTQFIEKIFLLAAYRGRSLVTCFNFPFDASRIALNSREARGAFAGGFSLVLWQYTKATGERREDLYRPRILIKTIDSKRALKRFSQRRDPDPVDLIPEGSLTGEPEENYAFRGNLLDLRTLGFALTNESHSLASAGKAFGVPILKGSAPHTGRVTPQYIRYNRRDVAATAALLAGMRAEYDRHPIALRPMQAYSPASVGKAYLDAMGIPPVLERQPDFPKEILGHAMSAFYGGRAECRIRKVPIPVVYCDFLSMYPTVNALMGLWGLLTAARIDVREDTEGVREFVDGLTLDGCFDPATWKAFPALVQVHPDGEILPTRAKYAGADGDNWAIGINPLTSDPSAPKADPPLWYALPDVIAAKLLTGKTPTILRTLRLVPGAGKVAGLTPIQLRGAIPVDPATGDFFRTVIEERNRVKADESLDGEERKRLDRFLKVLANSASYGIFAEMVRQELPKGKKAAVDLWGLFETPGRDRVIAPERPGRYCFPPLAACITAAARLMLALLERCITDAGGSYAFCDTDSMAIVATERGELSECPGGKHELGGNAAIRALTWDQVDAIVARFKGLNPYDPEAVTDSILKVEDENYEKIKDEQGKERRGPRQQLWCYAISAKRYALYNEHDGAIAVRKRSEHGLGYLLNPLAPADDEGNDAHDTDEDDDEVAESAVGAQDDAPKGDDWITIVWKRLIADALDRPCEPLAWLDLPALSRISVSGPDVLAAFDRFNEKKGYADRVKPFNFLLGAHIRDYGHPAGIDPAKPFQLIARFQSDPRQWLTMAWIDKYSKQSYRITATGSTGGPGIARVKTYDDVVREYSGHEEWKSAAPDGQPCRPDTRGLLTRRPVRVGTITYVGKESNKLMDVFTGQADPAEAKPNEYSDERLDPWRTVIVPVMREAPLAALSRRTGISESQLKRLRNGHGMPHPKTREAIIRSVGQYAQARLRLLGVEPPVDPIAACAALLSHLGWMRA